jgi:hypothetical protein
MIFEEKIIVYSENCLEKFRVFNIRAGGTCSDQCPLKDCMLFKYMRPVF